MTTLITTFLSVFGRRLSFWAALAGAVAIALLGLLRHGRQQAEAEFVIRRAEARIRAMRSAREIRHDVQNADRVDLDRRAKRWLRD